MTNNLAKWTPEEDQLVREGVSKYGIKWELVKGYMKNLRSINSIIKRWHGKIKYEVEMKNVRESTGRFTRILPEPPAKAKEDCDGVQEDNEEKLVVWKKAWSERDDKKLKLLVIESGIMDWKLLSEALEIEADQIKLRWKKVVYPKMIRQSSKVGGSLKWSVLEDKILNVGYRQSINWQDQGRIFLPQRSLGSIEARWRRVAKNFEVKSTAQNKYLARRQCLKRIARSKRQSEQQTNKLQESISKVNNSAK